ACGEGHAGAASAAAASCPLTYTPADGSALPTAPLRRAKRSPVGPPSPATAAAGGDPVTMGRPDEREPTRLAASRPPRTARSTARNTARSSLNRTSALAGWTLTSTAAGSVVKCTTAKGYRRGGSSVS